jgi:VanZ family protein
VVAIFVSAKIVQGSLSPTWDALEDFTSYTVMAILLAIGVARQFVWIAIAVSVVGAADELHYTGGAAMIVDWVIDTVGALLGAHIIFAAVEH